MNDAHTPPFGRLLKSSRIERGIALEAIAARTHISLQTLTAIEEERHAALPAVVYVKGFLRAYARQVAVDVEEVLHNYQISRVLFQEGRQHEVHGRRRERAIRRGLKIVLAVVLLLVGILATVLIMRWQETHRTAAGPAGAGSPAGAEPAAPAAAAMPAADPPAAGPVSPHQLNVLAVADTRIKVMIDNQSTREANLRAGDRMTFEAAKGFNLLLGNPAAVQLSLDGQAVKVPTSKGGQAVTLQLP